MADAFAGFGFGTTDTNFGFAPVADPNAGAAGGAAQQPAAGNANASANAVALALNTGGTDFGFGGADLTAPPAPTNAAAGAGAAGGVAATPGAGNAAGAGAAAGGGFAIDFGAAGAAATAPATGTAAAGTVAAAGTAPVVPAGDPALRLKDKTVEEILTQWSRDLEDHVSAFTEQALRIRHRDQQLIEQGQKIMNLQRAVQNVQIDQLKLTRVLETIKSNEDDLSAIIGQLEAAVDGVSAGKRTSTPDDVKRDEAYRLAETVDAQLNAMNGDLHDIIQTLNKATDSALDPSHPMTAVVKILNAHMTSLQYIETASNALDSRLRTAAQLLHGAATAKR